jgi:hypothetical protein
MPVTVAWSSLASLLPQSPASHERPDFDLLKPPFFLHPQTSTHNFTTSQHSHTTTMPDLSLLWRKHRHIAPPGTLGVAASSYSSGKCGVKGTQATFTRTCTSASCRKSVECCVYPAEVLECHSIASASAPHLASPGVKPPPTCSLLAPAPTIFSRKTIYRATAWLGQGMCAAPISF